METYTGEKLRNDLIDTGLLPIFEIEVRDKITGKQEYIIFDISFAEDTIEASHESLNEAQSNSDQIPFVSVDIDEDFNLKWHLAELYQECTDAIINSDFYDLT